MKKLVDKIIKDVDERMDNLDESLTPTEDEIALCALICRIEELEEKVDKLEEDKRWLDALEAAGVDNWCGYDQAQDIMEEWGE